jgi:hypothetical protein
MEQYALVHKTIPFANEDSFRKELAAEFDYHRVAAVEKSKGQTITPALRAIQKTNADAPKPEDLVEPIFHAQNVISVQAYSTKPGLLILNERWSKDWHARVNSQPAKSSERILRNLPSRCMPGATMLNSSINQLFSRSC